MPVLICMRPGKTGRPRRQRAKVGGVVTEWWLLGSINAVVHGVFKGNSQPVSHSVKRNRQGSPRYEPNVLKTSPIHKKSLNKCPKIIDYKLTQEKTHLHKRVRDHDGRDYPSFDRHILVSALEIL